MLLRRLPNPLVVAGGLAPDRHGYLSLGTNADYVAPSSAGCRSSSR